MIEVRKLTQQNWPDFVQLMESDRQCRECWCLNHRVSADKVSVGQAARAEMQSLVAQEKVSGLLGYFQERCCAWISVDPMSVLAGHDCQGTARSQEWAIHCVYIDPSFRGRGFSRQLIQHAVNLAANQGASLVSAFPIPAVSRTSFPKDLAEFSGRESTYRALGFAPAGELSDFYQRYELPLP